MPKTFREPLAWRGLDEETTNTESRQRLARSFWAVFFFAVFSVHASSRQHQQHVYQRRCRLHGQAAVLHTPQPGGPRDRKGTLEITRELTLGIPRLETGRTSGRGRQRRHKGQHEGASPGHTNDPVDSPVRKEKAAQPPPCSGASRRQLSPVPRERHQLASPRSIEHHCRHLGSPRSTEHHPQSSRDRSIHADTRSALASEVARAKRAFEVAKATILRREADSAIRRASSWRRTLRRRRPW